MWTYHGWVEYGWGDGPSNRRILQIPPLRLIYSGHAMVSLFFVVGGYVSSAKAIKLARRRPRQHEQVYLTLTSSLFRRGIRLYLPALASTFITMCTIRIGLWEPARQYVAMPYIFQADNHHIRLPSLGAQLADWWSQFMGLTNIWSYYNHVYWQPYYNQYDPHLWTVPMEMRGSLVVTLALLGLLRCRAPWRLALMVTIIIFCVYWDRWECMQFVLGAMLAEGYLIASEAEEGQSVQEGPVRLEGHSPYNRSSVEEEMELMEMLLEKPSWPTSLASSPARTMSRLFRNPTTRVVLRVFLFVIAIYFFAAPNHRYETSTGYSFIPYLVPKSISDPKRFVHGIGSALLVMSVSWTPVLQTIFNHSVPQYLGKISYSLYICHGPVIHMVGMYITPSVWAIVGFETMGGWLFGFCLGSCVTIFIVLWAADMFWRVIDTRCVSASRWFEGMCFDKED
ncbi:Acyltransferase 3 [Macrophomina phaseolina MS6]|uniref:Acyltransferase 3 n=1 Tax=Macrophomina phaseolina (strain MS6) TaxID=1126212 RepID=K2QJJ8_MACPH|nr:Acyltransferase 3 [Macrophomina phaseolina MS6]